MNQVVERIGRGVWVWGGVRRKRELWRLKEKISTQDTTLAMVLSRFVVYKDIYYMGKMRTALSSSLLGCHIYSPAVYTVWTRLI